MSGTVTYKAFQVTPTQDCFAPNLLAIEVTVEATGAFYEVTGLTYSRDGQPAPNVATQALTVTYGPFYTELKMTATDTDVENLGEHVYQLVGNLGLTQPA